MTMSDMTMSRTCPRPRPGKSVLRRIPDFEAKTKVKATKNNIANVAKKCQNIANTTADVAKTFPDDDNVANVAKTGGLKTQSDKSI